ncbi:MAG TPA: hypothetical protein VFO73_16055, partial [Candidatus Limnocylindrales bacterium]|nr:hypothetical protein [Candidatus Limnocylindrales bacterium]
MTTAPAASRIDRERAGDFVRKYFIIMILVGFVALLALLTGGKFLQTQNLINVVRQVSVIAITAIGVSATIIALGIDLSIGSIIALSAVVASSLAQQPDATNLMYPGLNLPVFVAIGAGLLVGALAGFTNGFLIARF